MSNLDLEYFSGGVPTGEAFRGTLEEVRRATGKPKPGRIDRLSEICFVGALSYFEAFCKDHASTVISIVPDLIDRLRASGHNVSIDALKALQLGDLLPVKVGFLVLESCDFGTARKINSVYECLIKVTPFSKTEAKRYEALLRDRNLIVHHGSVFTTKYLDQSKRDQARGISDAFMNSLVVDPARVSEEIDFLLSIARKLMSYSYDALRTYTTETDLRLDPGRQKALEYFRWWGDEDE